MEGVLKSSAHGLLTISRLSEAAGKLCRGTSAAAAAEWSRLGLGLQSGWLSRSKGQTNSWWSASSRLSSV